MQKILKESWKPVPGMETFYDVSSYGRVRTKHLIGRRTKDGFKTPVPNQKGYLRVGLRGGGKRCMAAVHRLVLLAFVGPAPSKKHEGNHKDGIKSNNLLENLEWVTPVENNAHSVALGLWHPNIGEAHGRAKLKEIDIPRIRSYEGKYSLSSVAKLYGVTPAAINLVWKRKNWAHVR